MNYNYLNYRIIIAGSRDFTDYDLLKDMLISFIDSLPKSAQIEIISGTARGADSLGEQLAKEIGYTLKRFPADWERLGKKAGYIRNNEMAEYASGAIGYLFAFWDGQSKGTEHMINLAHKHGLTVHVINYKELDKQQEEIEM